MIIRFEQTGGIVGGGWAVTVDTARMSQSEAQALEEMVQRSGLFDLPRRWPRAHPSLAVDVYEYDVSVRDGKRRSHVRLDDTEVPVGLRPLIGYLAGLVT